MKLIKQMNNDKISYADMPGDVKVTIRELIETGSSAEYCYKQAKKYVQDNNSPRGRLVTDYISYPEAMNWIREHPNSFLKAWGIVSEKLSQEKRFNSWNQMKWA